MSTDNPYPKQSLWIGKRYADPENPLHHALILGESSYDQSRIRTDPHWIIYWINKEQKDDLPDWTFSRIHWVTTSDGRESCRACYRRTSSAQLQDWFDGFAFYNYIPEPLKSRKSRPTVAMSAAAEPEFRRVVQQIEPKCVWTLWPEPHATVALDVLERCGVPREKVEVMHKFAAYMSNDELPASWQRFRTICRG